MMHLSVKSILSLSIIFLSAIAAVASLEQESISNAATTPTAKVPAKISATTAPCECPDTDQSLQPKIDQCLTDHSKFKSQTLQTIQTLQTKTSSLQELLEDQQQESQSLSQASLRYQEQHDALLQQYTTLEEKQKKLQQKYTTAQAKHDKNVRGMRHDLKELHDSNLRQATASKRKNKEYLDAREEIQALEIQLKQLHRKIQSIYVNYKLMGEDLGWAMMKALDKGIDWSHDIQKKGFKRYKREIEIFEKVIQKVNKLFQHHLQGEMIGLAARLRKVDAVEGIRLTLVAMVKSTSNIVLNYIELTKAVAVDVDVDTRKSSKYLNLRKRKTKTRARLDRSLMIWLKKAEKDPDQFVNSFFARTFAVAVFWLLYKSFKVLVLLGWRVLVPNKKGRKVKKD